MTDDIVKRLQNEAQLISPYRVSNFTAGDLMLEAAAEIERLDRKVQDLKASGERDACEIA